ncbi:MAG: thermonuclease family protein [Planctomycetaceae bacterium]
MPVRFRRRRSRRTWAQTFLLLLVFAAFILHRLFFAERDAEFPFDPERLWRVERVVDGDTLLLEQGHRVRLIGVDAPETKHPSLPPEPFGAEASEFTRRLVEGRMVRLGFDRERRDRYRRILAYVYVEDVFVNEELIRAGWSPAVTRFPYSAAMKRRFEAAEAEARAAGRGMWAAEESATNRAAIGDASPRFGRWGMIDVEQDRVRTSRGPVRTSIPRP